MDEYLIWSNEHQAWWRPERRGYTVHIKGAGRYSRSEALQTCRTGRDYRFPTEGVPSEVPVRLEDVMECTLFSASLES